MVSLKHYDSTANMPMSFAIKNVNWKTGKRSLRYPIYVVKFSNSCINFDTNFEMINVISLKLVKNMLVPNVYSNTSNLVSTKTPA